MTRFRQKQIPVPLRAFAMVLFTAAMFTLSAHLFPVELRAVAENPAIVPAPPPEHWAAAIGKLTTNDLVHPPVQDGIVFVGSSSIVKWTTLEKDFAGLPVINRGFGGSVLADSVFYADRIVIPYHPRTVVLYAGENDIASGKSPQVVAGDFVAFCGKIRAALPKSRIIYLGIKPSPVRWQQFHEKMEEANRLIAAECAKNGNTFIDLWKPMIDAQGQPRAELFVADRLHMNSDGYSIWTKIITPYLKQ